MRRIDFLAGVASAPLLQPSAFADLERRTGGRLGVFALDTANGKTIGHRATERFPMCSTFKLLLVAAALTRVDRGEEQLDRHVPITQAQILPHATVSEKYVARGYMTVEEMCGAAIDYSDNTAANTLLASIGGPPGYTRYVRSLGDAVTRLDRPELALNSCIPGDPRDTTAPASTVADMQRVLVGSGLRAASRTRLLAWLKANTTGGTRLRAGLPDTWVVGDKTGTGIPTNRFGDSDTANDIAIVWPPNRSPLLMAVYLTQSKLRASQRDATIARAGTIIAQTFG